jgi:hypothetical protein
MHGSRIAEQVMLLSIPYGTEFDMDAKKASVIIKL